MVTIQVTKPRRGACLRALLLALAAAGMAAAAAPAETAAALRPGEVSLPLKDYLALADGAERAERGRAAAKAHHEAPVAEVVAQRTAIEIRDAATAGAGAPAERPAAAADGAARAAGADRQGEAHLATELEVLVQGHPETPVALPLTGVAVTIAVQPPGAHAAGSGPGGPGLYLVAPEPGRYTVKADSREQLASGGGVSRLTLPRIVAPVAVLTVGLPAELAWECPGAVTIEDRVEGGRRRLRLTAARGQEPVLTLHRAVAGDQAASLLVQDVTATFLQLRPEGLRRHDVVLYEVARGALADFEVELPPGLEVEQVGTDEGVVPAIVEGGRVIVHRQHRLLGTGYMVLTSRPAAAAGALPLGLVRPEPAPRARYLAIATSLPGSVEPRPAARWARVDLEDLPAALNGALSALDATAAWRLAAETPAGGLDVALITTPQAALLETVIRRRLTTTLLTVDGTLLHRDSFELAQAGAALTLTLPAGATLWSAAVDGVPVRPLVRGASLAVPLGGGAKVVEVVEVLEQAIAKGRSRLDLELAQLQAPVVEHRWRLLLPESARYRFAGGDLQPAHEGPRPAVQWLGSARMDATELRQIPAARDPWQVLQNTPGVLADKVNVGGGESGKKSSYVGLQPGRAALAGRVLDQQGAPLPGVTVTLSGAGDPPRVELTNAEGEFAFSGLPPAVYEMKAELQGFSSIAYPRVQLEKDRLAQTEISLSAAAEEDVITVTAEAPILDARKLSSGITVSGAAADRATPTSRAAKAPPARPSLTELNELRQGLVGGVRPLPVAIPQSGKALLLTAVLPPARVAVQLEVKADRR